jgi:sugar transferase EpsL
MPRFLDYILVALAGIVLLPVYVIVAGLVWLSVGRPVLFVQNRGGLHSSIFKLYKFRTMTNDRDQTGALLPDAERLTRVGKFIRSSSLDELPSLLNILKGDMRLVGPRPFVAQYLTLYTPAQARRHEVRPGITGWAQVNGRNTLSWEEKFDLDVWYVDNRTFWLDLKIIWMTLRKVIERDGISADGEATMPYFEGYKDDDGS